MKKKIRHRPNGMLEILDTFNSEPMITFDTCNGCQVGTKERSKEWIQYYLHLLDSVEKIQRRIPEEWQKVTETENKTTLRVIGIFKREYFSERTGETERAEEWKRKSEKEIERESEGKTEGEKRKRRNGGRKTRIDH